jgi:hypothetical protein
LDDGAEFLLDAPEYSDEEWEERPRCNWSFPSFTFKEYKLPAYACPGEPRWRFLTTYSNALKTNTIYCHTHGIFFHEGVYTRTMIDHMTLPDTTVIDMTTEEVCECTNGEECAAMAEQRERTRQPRETVVRALGALEFWN